MSMRLLTTFAVALAALACAMPRAHAYLGFTAGETAGTPFGAPLPEGLFAVDLQSYGQRDVDAFHGFGSAIGPVPGGGGNSAAGPGPNLNLNLPTIVWSTPVSLAGTRLELLYSAPVVSFIARRANQTNVFNQAFGPILAHGFGNGVSVSLAGFIRPPSAVAGFVDHSFADLRAGLSYLRDGYDLSLTFGYTGTFGGHQGGRIAITGSSLLGNADAVDVDLTATKRFGRWELGAIGYAFTDIDTRGDNSTTLANGRTASLRVGAVAVGPLVGYDAGSFTAQVFVLRQVADRNGEIIPSVGGVRNPETRGFLRLAIPLYVAPKEGSANERRSPARP